MVLAMSYEFIYQCSEGYTRTVKDPTEVRYVKDGYLVHRPTTDQVEFVPFHNLFGEIGSTEYMTDTYRTGGSWKKKEKKL